MKKSFEFLILTLSLLFIFTSCDHSILDGDWDPMKWHSNQAWNEKNKTFDVPADGGFYSILCTNYSSFWITSVKVNNEDHYLMGTDIQKEFDNVDCTANIYNALLSVQIKPNISGQPKKIVVYVEAGDSFSFIAFNQIAN